MSKIAYQHQDNWKNFGYSYRYLDALASLLHVQTDVTAVLEENNVIYLSYNGTLAAQSKKCVSLIQNLLTNLSNYSNDHILGIYLTLNVDFISLVKKSRNHVDEEGKKLLEEFILGHEKVYGNLNKNINKVKSSNAEDLEKYYTKQMVSNYTNILDYFSITKELNSHLNTFLRPLQDSYKLYYYLRDTNTIFNDLIVLDNPNNIHADTNIVHYFPNSKYLDKNYMGVSKLCCGYCHKYLDENNYQHRGTHGVCDDQWKLPWPKEKEPSPMELKFKKSVNKIANFDQSNQPIQYRKLSFDSFEENIPISKEKTLWDFKVELGFIKKSKPVKLEQNLSLIEEPNIESYLVATSGDHHIDPNVLKVIGGGSELWEGSEDLYC